MIISNPPSSWIKAAMAAGLVDENHDAKTNLMDAINRGFSLHHVFHPFPFPFLHLFLAEMDSGTEKVEEKEKGCEPLFPLPLPPPAQIPSLSQMQ